MNTEPTPAASAQRAFARLPILDARRRMVACELVDNGPDDGAAAPATRDADLLLQALGIANQSRDKDGRLLFVRCHLDSLRGEHLDLLDPARLVIEVALPAGATPEEVDAGIPVLAALVGRGLRIALRHDALGSLWQPWLAHASFLMVDTGRLPPAALPAVAKVARRHADLRLVACGVQTAEHQAQAAGHGIEWFQGPWYTQPVWVRSQVLRPNQATVLELIGLIRGDAGMDRIEALLKRDPTLSLKLLRFINSSGFGLSCEITSFAHAVMILGMDNLLRWACLLVATAQGGTSPAAAHTAVVRGRLMELLASQMLTREECDHAFVAGVFSLLDTLTGVALPTALEGLPLPDAVLEAVLHRRGPLAPFLDLTEACESANDASFARFAGALALSGHQVNMAHLEALAWTDDLLAA